MGSRVQGCRDLGIKTCRGVGVSILVNPKSRTMVLSSKDLPFRVLGFKV